MSKRFFVIFLLEGLAVCLILHVVSDVVIDQINLMPLTIHVHLHGGADQMRQHLTVPAFLEARPEVLEFGSALGGDFGGCC